MKNRITVVRGLFRTLFILYMRFYVLIYVLKRWLCKEVSFKQIQKFFQRSLEFSLVTKTNKFISVKGHVKQDYYLPGVGTRAFLKSVDKLLVTDKKMPCSSALISVTSACRNRCEFCYQKRDGGRDMDIDVLVNAVTSLKERGVSFFTVQGGDPFLRFDRLEKVTAAMGDGVEIWVNSTGDGVTRDRLEILKKQGVSIIVFSLHSPDPEEFNAILQNPLAWDNLVKGVELSHEAGLGVAFNMTLFKPDFYNGQFQRLMQKAREFDACYIQLIKPKPSGAWLEEEMDVFSKEDYLHIKNLVHTYNHHRRYRDYPSVWAQIINEDKEVFGCVAGGTERVYINSRGDLQPCEFINISMGNLEEEEFDTVYERTLEAFHTPCSDWLCETCAESVHREFTEGKHPTLPLPCDTSLKLLKKWDRGPETPFYRRIK